MSEPWSPVFRIGCVDRICFLRWLATPTVPQVREIVGQIVEARRQLRAPMSGLGILSAEITPPSIELGAEMLRLNNVVEQACDWSCVVVEGSGLRRTLVHGFVVALNAAMRQQMSIMPSPEAALRVSCGRLGLDPGAVLREAQERDLAPASWRWPGGDPPGAAR